MTTKHFENVGRVQRKQSLYASVIRSCENCGAPGYWHDVPGVNVGCYAPEKVTKFGEDAVGTVCPNCGAAREEITRLGEIWSKEWRVSLWSALTGAANDFLLRWRAK